MNATNKKHKALGRGLDQLLGGGRQEVAVEQPLADGATLGAIQELPLALIKPNESQPRQAFDDEALSELADSIRHLGLVQPITVTPLSNGDYRIISGERRYRASMLAGLQRVPAYVRRVEEDELLELALVENIQREDLNAIEIALAYHHLIDRTGLTQEALAERVGKKRATISNYLRLLKLPSQVQIGLSQRLLDMGHAKALLQVDDVERQIELYELIVREQLSVREVEELARRMKEPCVDTPQQPKRAKQSLSEEYRMLEKHLAKVFSAKVALRYSAKGKGQISIPFAGEEDLERIMQLLERIQQS